MGSWRITFASHHCQLQALLVSDSSLFWFKLNDMNTKDIWFQEDSISCHTVHTYINNWSLQPFSQDYDLASRTTCDVCLNFIHTWRELQFKVDSERQIFWDTFHDNFIYSQSFCQTSAERKSPKKYFLYFVLMSGLGLEPWLYVFLLISNINVSDTFSFTRKMLDQLNKMCTADPGDHNVLWLFMI